MTDHNRHNYKHPSTVSLFNVFDTLPFPSVKGKFMKDIIKDDPNFFEWGLKSTRIFCFDDYSYKYALDNGLKLSDQAIAKQTEKRKQFNDAVLEFNENVKGNTDFCLPADEKIRLHKLSYKISFGHFAGKTVGEILELSPSRIEFYIHTLPWFGLTREGINKLTSLEPKFIFLKTTLELLEQKYQVAPDFMKGISRRHDDNSDYSDASESKYAGTYAQDVEGLSDDFIDDVLGGDPDAYWNID